MEEQATQQENIVRDIKAPTQGSKFFSVPILLGIVIIVLLGVVTGYFLSSKKVSTGGITQKTQLPGAIKKGTVVGSEDTKTFRDSTEGTLEEGGVDGEGSHHLVRPGGESQNVYLTSSVVDLGQFVGKKIKVWGETNKAQKAGWLMDVGRVEILE